MLKRKYVNVMRFRSLFGKEREKIVIQPNQQESQLKIINNVQTNIDNLYNILDNPDDLKIRTLTLGSKDIKVAFAFIEGIVDAPTIHESILGKLEQQDQLTEKGDSDFEQSHSCADMTNSLLSGSTIIMIDCVACTMTVETIGGEQRAIEEPVSETLIRGPRSGFVENIQTNLALIRRRAKDSDLRFKTYNVGTRSKTTIVLGYVEGIINPEYLEEAKKRIESIDIDIIPESGYIEEWIEDSFLSPFPQISNTERPDTIVAAMMQGKFAIIVDGTPF